MQIQELDTLVQKPRLNKTETNKVCEVLLNTGDTTLVCEYLFKLPLTVTANFFQHNYSALVENSRLDLIVKSLISHEMFNKNTRDCSALRCLEIINTCFEQKNYSDIVEQLLAKTLTLAVKNNIYRASFLNHFRKKVFNKTNVLLLNVKEENKLNLFLLIAQLQDDQFTSSNELTSSAIYNEYTTKKAEIIELIINSTDKTSNKSDNSALTAQIQEQATTIDRLTAEIELLKKLLEDEQKKTQDLVESFELSFGMN